MVAWMFRNPPRTRAGQPGRRGRALPGQAQIHVDAPAAVVQAAATGPGLRRQHSHASFFALLQKNVPVRRRWTPQPAAHGDHHWIERTCHHRRRQRRLGKLTPIECEMLPWPHSRPDPSTRRVNQGQAVPEARVVLCPLLGWSLSSPSV